MVAEKTSTQGASVVTGSAIRLLQLFAQYQAAKLELIGLRHSSGRSFVAYFRKAFGLKGSRAAVVSQVLDIYKVERIVHEQAHTFDLQGESHLDDFALKAKEDGVSADAAMHYLIRIGQRPREAAAILNKRGYDV